MGNKIRERTDRFTTEQATEIYGLESWGRGYFHILPNGHLAVRPRGRQHSIDVPAVMERLLEGGYRPPVLLRFPQLLEGQLQALTEAFRQAIDEFGYTREYVPVFPVKVNQQAQVVKGLLAAGQECSLGLEAGSRPELLVAAGLDAPRGSMIICNGYKDRDYLDTAAMVEKLGRKVILVVEKPFEIDMIVEQAARGTAVPGIGLRIKLRAKGSGLWERSGGSTSKFGLTTHQLLQGIAKLSAAGLADRIELLHFHIGSQVTQIRHIKNAVREAARVYSQVRREGIDIRFLDVGGGLGVDYDGSRTSSDGSVNYGIQEYANDIVFGIQEVCHQENIPCPAIISESGRMLTAFHSMLIADVRGVLSGIEQAEVGFREGTHKVVSDLRETGQDLNEKNYREYYHDALEYRDQMYSLFDHGALGLREKAEGEALFRRIAERSMEYARGARYMPEEFENLESRLRKKYICNLSVFQSLPDSFAVDQIFPIVPIHRLNERPDVRASLVDITCDSDGEVDRFIDLRATKGSLEVHNLIPGRPYYLGFLLIGAYQDTMGSPHNLFGKVHEAEAIQDENGDLTVTLCRTGQTALDSLRQFGHDQESLSVVVRKYVDRQVAAGALGESEGAAVIQEYARRLGSYTYLD